MLQAAGSATAARRRGPMPVRGTGTPVPHGDRSGRWALGAIAAVMALQALFLLVGCDWDFCGDEAEFWEWSRHLDWSYFARGPLIAWLIRLSTELFGPLSLKATGSLMFAARLPAVLLGGLTAWGTFRLAALTTGQPRVGLFAVLLLPAIPLFALGGILITCDTPLVCCWTWAAVWSYRAVLAPERKYRLAAWSIAGLIGAVGVWAKYSMLALPASIGLFLLLDRDHRREVLRPGPWLMALICAVLGMAPIVYWNARNGWAGMGQLADRVGLSERATWGGLTPVLNFLGGEAAALGGAWWIVGALAIIEAIRSVVPARKRPTEADANADAKNTPDSASDSASHRSGTLYLICQWAVLWLACLSASLLGETEANWMAPGYVAIVILIGRRIANALAPRPWGNRGWAYIVAWCGSIIAIVAIHHTDWFYPLIARWAPEPSKRWAAPLRLYDITARMRGHKELARAVQQRVDELSASGRRPFVMTPTYALTSTLSFLLPGQPQTYCLSWNYGMTAQPVNQHDLWRPNPRRDPEAFADRPFLVVEDANMPPNYATLLYHKHVIGRIGPVERIVARERGVIVGAWDITECEDYRGLAHFAQNRRDGPRRGRGRARNAARVKARAPRTSKPSR